MAEVSTVDRARGHWREILQHLGVAASYLTGKHGPCPCCGGKDRFRFDDKGGDGTYICNQCGAGNGIILIRKLRRWDFNTACDEVDKIIGFEYRAPDEAKPRAERPANEAAKRRQAIDRVIWEATCPEIAASYLAERGIPSGSDVLLGHPSLFHPESKSRMPAMIAPISGPDGSLQSVQRIYIGHVTPRKMTMPPVDTIAGGAVRLFEAGDVLGISEGVETGLAARMLFNVPVWATISEGGMQAFEPPDNVQRFLIFGDNDSNFVGQAAAYALAKRLVRLGRRVAVHVPPLPDSDWCDVYCNGEGQHAT